MGGSDFSHTSVIEFPNGRFSLDNFSAILKRYNGPGKLHDGQYLKFKKNNPR